MKNINSDKEVFTKRVAPRRTDSNTFTVVSSIKNISVGPLDVESV